MRSTFWKYRITLAALLTSLLVAPAFANTHDELASGEWEGKVTTAYGLVGGGAAPAPPTAPPAGTGGTGTPTPGDGDGDGTTTGGTPTEPENPTDPETPPPNVGGGDDDGDTMDPGNAPQGPPGGNPPPQTELASCNAKWLIQQVQPAPYLHIAQTDFTNVVFRSDQYAFLCNGYARSESSLFLDWGTQRVAGHTLSQDYEVALVLAGACANCAPRITVTGNGKTETKAKLKVLSAINSISPDSYGIARTVATWGGALAWKLNSSAAVFGGATGADSGIKFGAIEIGIGPGGEESMALDGDVSAGSIIIQGAQAVQLVSFWGGSSAGTFEDMENTQAKGRTAQRILMQGVSKCGPVATFDLTIQNK
jgi:hypothetical protein